MEIVIDPDVKATLEFMQANMPATKLVNVAKGVGDLAFFLWGHLQSQDVDLLRLTSEPISPGDPHTQPSSSEPRLAA